MIDFHVEQRFTHNRSAISTLIFFSDVIAYSTYNVSNTRKHTPYMVNCETFLKTMVRISKQCTWYNMEWLKIAFSSITIILIHCKHFYNHYFFTEKSIIVGYFLIFGSLPRIFATSSSVTKVNRTLQPPSQPS